jgi:hypothetical protein
MSGLNLSFRSKADIGGHDYRNRERGPRRFVGHRTDKHRPPHYSAMVPRYFSRLRVGTGAASIRVWLTIEALE